MQSRYFIRTNQHYEIVYWFDNKKSKYVVKEFEGEYIKIGDGYTKLVKETFFETCHDMNDYVDNIILDILFIGYIESKKATLIEFEDYEDLGYEDYEDLGYEDYEDSEYIDFIGKTIDSFKDKEHICISSWSEMFESGPDEFLEYFIKNKEKYKNTEYFTFGNVDYAICEISWITQSNYTEFFKAFPNIKGIFIQGMNDLKLGVMDLPNLETLEIQGSGLTNRILEDISKSNLPSLKRLNLYFGIEDYGLDVDYTHIKLLLDFLVNCKNFKILGLCNSDIKFTHIILDTLFNSQCINQIEILDISKSGKNDENAQYIIDNIDKLKNIKYIDMSYNFFSNKMIKKLNNLLQCNNILVDLSDVQEAEEEILEEDYEDKEEFIDDFIWNYLPMYTE